MTEQKRLTIVQYAGDFRDAANRLAECGAETYRAQHFTVEYVESLAQRLKSVTTITGLTESKYDEVMPSGARAIGAGFSDRVKSRDLVRLVASTEPDLLILRAPLLPLLHWAVTRRCRTLALLADSFNGTGSRAELKRRLLAFYINRRSVSLAANHGVSAARQLVSIGVRPDKIVPWDYPAFATPSSFSSERAPSTPLRLVYVGLLSRAKGIFDLIEAVRILRDKGMHVMLDMIGGEQLDEGIKETIEQYSLSNQITLVGSLPNAQIIPAMRGADIVVVPSLRHYPEGMPLTIYEALCSRTPLVASNHPMFLQCIRDEESALIFKAGDPLDMAEKILRLSSDQDLYERLSENAISAWERIQLPVMWNKLIDAWIHDAPDDRAWLSQHSLSKHKYDP